MKIKNRLSLYFTAVSALVLLIVEVVICITFNSFIKSDFYGHLLDRANVAAQLYLEADEITPDSLSHVRDRFLQKLPNEVVRFYNDKNSASFIKDQNQFWTGDVINGVRNGKLVEFSEGIRQSVGLYYKDNQGDFVILVSAIDNQGIKRVKDLIEGMAFLLLFVTALLFVISRWFAQKALQPMDKVIEQMQQVRASNLGLRVDEGNGKDEISALAQNFNKLLEHLENAFELQQTFIINASHELRTPITTIIGEIEIARNKVRTNAEYDELLASVLNDVVKLKETITSLLELANVDMNYTQPAYLPVDINELVWELSDYWNNMKGKGMFNLKILHLPEDEAYLQVLANKALLIIAFNNIINNAFKFSGNKPVKCGFYAGDDFIRIEITDVGIGIPEYEIEKIFESFFRADNVRSYNGNGIGLYVTNKIIRLFNGTIKVKSLKNESTTFTVEFRR